LFHVPEANVLVIQAAVMQRDFLLCQAALVYEYVICRLFLILLKFFADRITQLVQSKYLHILIWKRFCTHGSVVGQFYPLYQE
ncbi:CF183 protein, partial [Buphagus erythrorhynchus]|nr:CF183 protein [Buphagus erythrorhynchus]